MIAKLTREQASKVVQLARSDAGRAHLTQMLETQRTAAQAAANLQGLGVRTAEAASEAEAIAFNIQVLETAAGGLQA